MVLLTLGAGPGPIAAADLARHDRGPDRVFGAPIRGVNRHRIQQEREQGWELDDEMRGKPLHIGYGPRPIEAAVHARLEAAARHGQAVHGQVAGLITIPHGERLLERGPYVRWECRARVIGQKQLTPAQQMRQARLRDGVDLRPIRHGPVMPEFTAEYKTR
jgi:hypothetical protein